MESVLAWLFDPSGLTPHGFCLLWKPGLIYTHALSDLAIGAAYVSISVALAVIVTRRRDVSFRPLVWLFISFILLCGATHWMDLLTLWVPSYGVQGVVKAATATVSVFTAFVLWRLLPAAMAQPSLAEFRALNEALRTNQEFLDRVGRIAGVGGWEYDVDSDRIVWSEETYRIHGVPPDYPLTVGGVIDFYAPESRPIVRAAFEAGLAKGEAWDLELPFDRADGQRIWVRVLGKPTFSEGRAIRIAGVLQDVTDLRNARLSLERANQRAVLAADSGGIGIWEWNMEQGDLAWDAWTNRLYGLDPGDTVVTYADWARRVHPQDRASVEQTMLDAISNRKPFEGEFRILWDDGSVHHIRASGHVTRDDGGRAVRMVGANWDVTRPRRLAADLAEQHELLRVTLESIGDGVVTTDIQGRVTWMNPVAEQMTGWTSAEAHLQPLSLVLQLIHQETRAPAESPLALCMAEGRIVGIANNTVLVSRDGREFGIQDSASPIRDDQGEMLGMVVVFHDVTEQRRLSGEMSYRASHDLVTGLVNRAEFEPRVHRALQRAQTGAAPSVVLYIDLDQFKIINDSCGHAIGDQVLIQIARLIEGTMRSSDTVARLGGDEFGVLLEDCPLAQAQALAQRICDRVAGYRFVHDEKLFRIGASIGLAQIDDRWPSLAALLQAADSACFAAKDAGRNRVHVWHDSDETIHTRNRQMHWAIEIETALDEGRFELFHQRIQTLGDRDVGAHAEVLLRMRDREGALAPPGAFLPAAERFHLASRIDRWVLSQVIAWMGDNPNLDRIDMLGVNLSGQSIGDRSFHRWAVDKLAEAGPRICQRLCFEITETAVVTNLADAARFIQQVREAGVRVALDDFGAGASSFGYLKMLPVDILKIDGQFIRNVLTDPLDAAAVRCFTEVAKLMGFQTVAEWVDDPDLPSSLKFKGIDFAQGYLFHRPAPISEFLKDALETGVSFQDEAAR